MLEVAMRGAPEKSAEVGASDMAEVGASDMAETLCEVGASDMAETLREVVPATWRRRSPTLCKRSSLRETYPTRSTTLGRSSTSRAGSSAGLKTATRTSTRSATTGSAAW